LLQQVVALSRHHLIELDQDAVRIFDECRA